MNLKYIRNTVLILTLVVLSAGVGYRLGERQTNNNIGTSGDPLDLSLMWKVKSKLEQLYLDKSSMDKKNMSYGAIKGMVDSLGDPYTFFLSPDENKASTEDLAGEFGGVGISLGFKEKSLAVMSPVAKTPADRAGIKAGDLILKITDKKKGIDKDTTGITLDEAVSLIRGPIGSEVTLKLFREGKSDTFDVTLVRENIVVPSIETEVKESQGKRIVWIKMYKFTDRLTKEWNDAVSLVKTEEKKGNFGGIVLDLRNNPGGYLMTSVEIASDFLKEGVVVKQEASDGTTETYTVDKSKGRLLNEKLVVLVNGGSASAAEILSGALKEYGRGKLVGEKTFGKGTVQSPEDFSDGSGLHVTIARWLLPSGKNIHKEGVMPDVEVKYEAPASNPVSPSGTPTPTPANGKTVEIPDNQLNKAIEVLLQ